MSKHLYSYLETHIVFVDEPEVHPDEVSQFWVALGFSGDWLEKICEINPFFRNGKLEVPKRHQGNDSLVDQLHGLICYSWRFKKFNDKFCTLAVTARSLVAAEVLGLTAIVNDAKKKAGVSSYYIHGFDNLSEGEGSCFWRFLCVSSIAAYVADGFLLSCLEDDRLMMRWEEVKDVMADELRWISSLSEFTWSRLASVAGGEEDQVSMRTRSTHSGLVIHAFISMRVLMRLAEPPFSMTIGDIEKNVFDLRNSPACPEEDLTSKSFCLLRECSFWAKLYF